MNFLKRFSFALAFCFVASIPVWGQSANVVYVATGGSQVYAVTTDSTATPTSLIPAGDLNISAEFTSLTVGPDNTSNNTDNSDFFLYACDTGTGAVVRLTMSTTSPGSAARAIGTVTTAVAQPVCGRVDSSGDLYVSSASSGSGVYVIRGVSTASALPLASTPLEIYSIGGSFTGGGITQKNNGDMLIVDRADNRILKAAFVGAIPPASVSPTSPFASKLTNTNATGLNSPSAIARTSAGYIFVANQGNATVERYDPANLSANPTACSVSIPSGNVTLSSLAASEDNYVYVGIASTSPNKRTVLVLKGGPKCTSTTTSFSLSNTDAKSVAAVAVPPVPLAVTPTKGTDPITGDALWTFNFGNSVLQTLTTGCQPQIQQSQVSVTSLAALLSGVSGTAPDGTTNFSNGQAVPLNGEGGFGTAYTVENASNCQPDSNAYNNFILGGFDDTTQFTNTRIIHCDTLGDPACDVSYFSGFWPVGGLLPDDTTIGGKVPGFSKFFLANGKQEATSETGTFCGFGSPLTTTADGEPPASFSSGQNLSVKFEIAQMSGTCSNGPFITDAVALLSVAQVPNMTGTGIITPVTVESSGNSTAVAPIFTFSPTNKQYQFSLSLKGYAPGTYALIVTFLSNTTLYGGATYVVTYFNVQ
jgi:hypothetical protein